MKTLTAKVGNVYIGSEHRIVVQTMCNTHTNDVSSTVNQCIRLYKAGAEIVRITVPGMKDVPFVKEIKERIKAEGFEIPIVADIHFSSETAIAVAPIVEKVRINPGNFHKDHNRACEQFARLVKVCKENNTAIRIGVNHGSLGERITQMYGNTANAMSKAALEWINLCIKNEFYNVVVSLKASNTLVMVKAYRILTEEMKKMGIIFPLHLGVTEAGNGDSGRIKSCVGISALLSEGIGNTIRVSLTEDPESEIPVAKYLADRYDRLICSSLRCVKIEGRKAEAIYDAESKEKLMFDLSCDFGKRLLDRELDNLEISGTYINDKGEKTNIKDDGFADYLIDELLQATRRKFYRPEYIACPGCGRTMYNLEQTFEDVKKRTGHFKDTVVAIMGCIVNGPGEMADADWGYVGEGNNKVSIYKKHEPILRHIDEKEAIDKLIELIEEDKRKSKPQD